MGKLNKIVLHWTGGTGFPSDYEKTRYHFLVDMEGKVHEGDKPPEANRSPLRPGYVMHAGGFNSDAIGVALCGMAGAREHPFWEGSNPITQKSYSAAIDLMADLCETYRITPSRQTVVMHSEVRPRWGRGKYKWDVNFLPGMTKPGDPIEMGDAMRQRVQWELTERRRPVDFWTRFLQHFGRAA